MLNNWKSQYSKPLWILAIVTLIQTTGSCFHSPTIYINEVFGRPVSIAGLVLMGNFGFSMLGSLLGGYLHDRFGGKHTLLIGTFLASVCVFSMAFYREWIAYIIFMVILGFSNGIVSPTLYALARGIWPEGGRKAFNLVYNSMNLGLAIGSAIGGMVMQASFTLAFVLNGATYAVAFAVAVFGLSKRGSENLDVPLPDVKRVDSNTYSPHGKNSFPSLLILCCGFMVCHLTYIQFSTIIPIYMHRSGLSITSYSLLWTINGVLILTAQPIISYLIRRLLPTLKSQLVTGIIFFMLAMLTLSLNASYSIFVIGMIVITIGEMFIWPAVPTAASGLAPKEKGGMYQGIVSGFAFSGRMVGPWVGGLLYDTLNVQVMFYGLAGVCFAGLICFWAYDRGKRSMSQGLSM